MLHQTSTHSVVTHHCTTHKPAYILLLCFITPITNQHTFNCYASLHKTQASIHSVVKLHDTSTRLALHRQLNALIILYSINFSDNCIHISKLHFCFKGERTYLTKRSKSSDVIYVWKPNLIDHETVVVEREITTQFTYIKFIDIINATAGWVCMCVGRGRFEERRKELFNSFQIFNIIIKIWW